MNYVIGNTPDLEAFNDVVVEWRNTGLPFTYCYMPGSDQSEITGGFGCLRFEIPLPEKKFFNSPSIEYRYSPELDEWVVDGQPTPASNYVRAVHTYFVSREGNY